MHSNIGTSRRCVWCGFESRNGQTVGCSACTRCFVLGVFQFSSHLLIGSSHMNYHNLEKDVKLSKNNNGTIRLRHSLEW